MTSLRYTKLECSSKDAFRPPSKLSFLFLFFSFGGVCWGGGGEIRDNLILLHIGGMDLCRSSTSRTK